MNASTFLRSFHILAVLMCVATITRADELVSRCHKMNAPEGLVIRNKPGTDGKRLGV